MGPWYKGTVHVVQELTVIGLFNSDSLSFFLAFHLLYFLGSFSKRFYLFIFREKGREGDREEEKH